MLVSGWLLLLLLLLESRLRYFTKRLLKFESLLAVDTVLNMVKDLLTYIMRVFKEGILTLTHKRGVNV